MANDLLINVTCFFRDQKAFELLETLVIPELMTGHDPSQPLRIWCPGCSTGEEAYSIAILFHEAFELAGKSLRLQIFASDLDTDAIAIAREGLYADTIALDMSPQRLAKNFTKEGIKYKVHPDLRLAVVFTVQNVLADPPFSRLDLLSCRNLLIYLQPDAQARASAIFHFSLRAGGFLLLGNSETVGGDDGRFQLLSKTERLYRHTALVRPGEFPFQLSINEAGRDLEKRVHPNKPLKEEALLGRYQRIVLEEYSAAAILIDSKLEIQFSSGPTERYLQFPKGIPTRDVVSMAKMGLRGRLRSAIHRCFKEEKAVSFSATQASLRGSSSDFQVELQPLQHNNQKYQLICFIDRPSRESDGKDESSVSQSPRINELERELESVRIELQNAFYSLELSGEEQKGIYQESLSVNEELQSLNEELTALNVQLRESLENQTTLSDDMKNVLYSTKVATLFLDQKLCIRFFTPATNDLFNLIPSDIGRPLADLVLLAGDSALLGDATEVLKSGTSSGCEVEGQKGIWYDRRILPYRTSDKAVAGVVVTFTDISDRKHAGDSLRLAKKQAELADTAKSRFLAAASHDLRQPLQTLSFLQGLLARNVEGEKAKALTVRLDETIGSMTSMLNALLDINQIEAGTVKVEIKTFNVGHILARIKDEFVYQASSRNLALRIVPCSIEVCSDPILLEQILRNLVSNALKYTNLGKVLIGCRRKADYVSVEVWDTGIGIPSHELPNIFDEYHQVDNPAREHSRGLGLGLSIVQRLAKLLKHNVRVHSRHGSGSAFCIEVRRFADLAGSSSDVHTDKAASMAVAKKADRLVVLVVEDDPEVRALLTNYLADEGHQVLIADEGIDAISVVQNAATLPSLVITDFNLPGELNGLDVIHRVREIAKCVVPSIILTGDISTKSIRTITEANCLKINKPVKPGDLTAAINRLMSDMNSLVVRPLSTDPSLPQIFVVDDDFGIRTTLTELLQDGPWNVSSFSSCEEFLGSFRPGLEACLLIDAYLPGMNGIELLLSLRKAGVLLPSIMITGAADVSTAVEAMKAGAIDLIEKPVRREEILACVHRALELARDESKRRTWHLDAVAHVSNLTARQRQVMALVLAGHASKQIAFELGMSQRTVENHRASIMKRMGVKSLPALARLALAAEE